MTDVPLHRILFHAEAARDLKEIPANMRERILDAIEDRLASAPADCGIRLRQSLRGYWKLRVGDYRVVYEIIHREIRIYGIMHRREAYAKVGKRTSKPWSAEGSR